MGILSFKADNWRRLSVLHLVLNPGLNRFTGKNYNGKTSALKAAELLLLGKKGITGIKNPVHDGAETANVEGIIETKKGDRYKVEAVVERDTTVGFKVWEIRGDKLRRLSSPIDVINELTGGGGVDGMKFANAKDDKERRQMIGELLGIDDQLKQFAKDWQAKYEERTEVNRTVKDLEARTSTLLPDKVERIDQAKLFVLSDEIETHNRAIVEAMAQRERLAESAQRTRQKATELQAQADDLAARAKAELNKVLEIDNELAALPAIGQPRDQNEVREQMKLAQSTNERAADIERQHIERAKLLQELADAVKEQKDLNDGLKEIEKVRAALMAATPMPLPELTITEDAVLYKGKAFPGDASAAEKVIVSSSVMMTLRPGQPEPEVKVLLLYNASELDTASLAEVEAFADSRGYQILAESVEESGNVGFYIEDGKLAKNNYDTPEQDDGAEQKALL